MKELAAQYTTLTAVAWWADSSPNKHVTLTSAPGSDHPLSVYQTGKKSIMKARVKILGYSTVEPR